MKNLLMLLFFGAVLCISGIFVEKPKVKPAKDTVNQAILKKEAEKRVLLRELNALVYKNTHSISQINDKKNKQ